MPARPPRLQPAKPTIEALMTAYLAEVASQAGSASRHRAEESLELLRDGLEGYGHRHLGRADRARWSAAFDGGDEAAFCRMFGARELVRYLDEFLGYFLIRKVAMPEDEVARTVEDVRDLVDWLGRTGAIPPASARKALGRIASASVDLPAAERLADALYEVARRNAPAGSGDEPQFDELVDDYLVIERVAPGRLWFLEGIGPVKVPEAASAVARPGWTVNLVLGRRGSEWHVLEVGDVYPETLA